MSVAELRQQLKAPRLVSRINAASFIFQSSHVPAGILAAPLRLPHTPPGPGPPRATWFYPGESGCKGQMGLPPAFQLPLGTQLSAEPREPKATSQAGPHNWYIVNSKTELLWDLGKPQFSLGLGFFI